MAYFNIIICGVGDTEVNISIIYIIMLVIVAARDVYSFAHVDAVPVCAFGRHNINLLCLRLDKVNTCGDYLNL